MTIKFVLPITPQKPRERFVVEFERDGSIWFPDYNLEYDQAISALGGERTLALKIYDEWTHETPESCAAVIENYLRLKTPVVWRFSADCAAHVLDIYEDEFKNDRRLRDAVDLVIRAILHGGHNKFLSRAYTIARKVVEDIQRIAYELGEDEKLRLVASFGAANAVRHTTQSERLDVVMIYATGHDRDMASRQELSWELRRFHDVILAKQQGKKWPPLEATP